MISIVLRKGKQIGGVCKKRFRGNGAVVADRTIIFGDVLKEGLASLSQVELVAHAVHSA